MYAIRSYYGAPFGHPPGGVDAIHVVVGVDHAHPPCAALSRSVDDRAVPGRDQAELVAVPVGQDLVGVV